MRYLEVCGASRHYGVPQLEQSSPVVRPAVLTETMIELCIDNSFIPRFLFVEV